MWKKKEKRKKRDLAGRVFQNSVAVPKLQYKTSIVFYLTVKEWLCKQEK